MDTRKVGLVGFGRFGRIHASALSKIRGVELTSVCVGTKESVVEAKKMHPEVSIYSDFEAFLTEGRADIIDIVSPNYLHAKQAMAAMECEKDLILEKPISINRQDADEILETAKRKKRKVQVVFEYRYAPFWKFFKSALEQDLVNKPTFAKLESWRGPFRTGSQGWRYNQSMVGHQLLEEAIHYFDLANWYFGNPQRVSGFTDSLSTWNEGRVSSAVITLEYSNGLKVLIEDTLSGVAGQNVVAVSGGGGAIIGMIYSGIETSEEIAWFRLKEAGGDYRSGILKPIDEVDNVALLLEDFVSRLERGQEPSVSLADGYNALSVDLSVISAVQSGVPEKPSYLSSPNQLQPT